MNTVRTFNPLADRYVFDFTVCTPKEGWAQIDTMQDASYYGTWANPSRRIIVSFSEGDITTQTADTDEEFVTAIRELQQWNDEAGYGPMKIDGMMVEEIISRFTVLGLNDLLH